MFTFPATEQDLLGQARSRSRLWARSCKCPGVIRGPGSRARTRPRPQLQSRPDPSGTSRLTKEFGGSHAYPRRTRPRSGFSVQVREKDQDHGSAPWGRETVVRCLRKEMSAARLPPPKVVDMTDQIRHDLTVLDRRGQTIRGRALAVSVPVWVRGRTGPCPLRSARSSCGAGAQPGTGPDRARVRISHCHRTGSGHEQGSDLDLTCSVARPVKGAQTRSGIENRASASVGHDHHF